ncbi:ATP-dependent DNA helicase Q1 [Fistulifera solaris]|uniref:DNA 3'-5' helicase n=1 Tax=Fistulifera solaris TaxID=1519565 RepID=A0A1Z5JCE5_FISSO|nr:ATP-dependent DNA helicase Q1 [Fistulifera solaris]|eukprot:GAX11626.1 ATP-dependent DNA helicase Q1 [Fistulifera solaris]
MKELLMEMKNVEKDLVQLDEDIDQMEERILIGNSEGRHIKSETVQNAVSRQQHEDSDHHEVSLERPSITQQQRLTQHPDEVLPEPSTQSPLKHTERVTPPSLTINPPLRPLELQRPRPATISTTTATASSTIDPLDYWRDDENFPWSQQMFDVLRKQFRIPSFRDHQKEIINATLSKRDVFVLMRTGGGKSLTYQLPALLEQHKVTFVVSPLLSLIQDQEEQMNQFQPGSAISFTSGIGSSEHAQRWHRVRDPEGGVCLVFVTPEKISQSNKLGSEMDRLHAQGRLARFVIDECHCACQWGHDFRPDYTKLGVLKAHFPSVPLLALTATASERVRDDVCNILRMNDYQFFRSKANRPNLTYSVVPKPEGKGSVTAAMAEFIHSKYPQSPGIVYTLSRKDADAVADELCQLGVVARPYHSDISKTQKEYVHQSWMRDETQVVVATIAFGLGINKPNVRFVLHHCISKTLEAYYQESGRAGRDGQSPTDCVLYYSPKDVMRMLKMVHGSSGEELVWPMIRYGQMNGNDAVCRATLMTHLGEPDPGSSLQEICLRNDGITSERREVGKHAKTLLQILHHRQQEGDSVTPAMLLKDWRSRRENALPCVQENPPSKDNLSSDDCERIIIALLLENIIQSEPKWSAYDTIIYVVLGPLGHRLLQSPNPQVTVSLPKHLESKSLKPASTKTRPKERKTSASDGAWLTTRKRKVPAQQSAAKKKTKVSNKPMSKATRAKKANVKAKPAKVSLDVIEIFSDKSDSEPLPLAVRDKNVSDPLWYGSEDEEYEFEG